MQKKIDEKKVGNRPIKKYKAGNISGAIWFNERQVNGNIVGFKTASLKRSWLDKEKNIWHDESLNLRRQDLVKLRIIIDKMLEELYMTEGSEND